MVQTSTTSRSTRIRRMLEQVDPAGQSTGLKESLESRRVPSAGPVLDVRRTSTEALEAEFALESLDVLRRGDAIDSEQQFALEAIVMPYYRPVVDVLDDYIQTSQLTNKWQSLGAPGMRPWVTDRVRAVGRINVPNLPSLPYAGTGFLVGDGLLMTNRHVASIFAHGLGSRRLQFQTGQTAAIDFYHENGKTTSESLTVENVVMIHPWWDMALLKVSGIPTDRKPLILSTADPATLKDREVVVIGYPGYDPNGDEEFQRIQNRIFRGTYYVKRFQPGLFKVRDRAESYEQIVDAVTHDCSTLGGNSGSAVVDVQSGAVVGLHFAGEYLVANFAVSPFDLAQDSRVVDAGVNFQGRLDPRGDFYGPIWRAADAVESIAATDGAAAGPIVQSPAPSRQPVAANPAPTMSVSATSAVWTIPLQVSVTIGAPTTTMSYVPAQIGAAPTLTPVPTPSEGLFSRPVPTVPMDRFSAGSLTASQFGWQTALSLALASKLSYDGAAAVRNIALNTWGLQTCEFIEADDTQCFVASSADAVLVAFRGTESLGDWLGNLNAISTTRSYGTVHRGFLGAFQVVDSRLRHEMAALSNRPVLLTGHSLGGALATIAAAEWAGQVNISGIYTYGQPAVGKGTFSSFVAQHFAGRFFRFVNDDDVVPRVPPTYVHVGRLFHFDARGDLQNRTESFVMADAQGPAILPSVSADGKPMLTEAEFDRLRAQLLEQRARARARGLESLEAPVLEGLIPSVSDHSLDRYLAKIAGRAGG